jgi:hypothetical protein
MRAVDTLAPHHFRRLARSAESVPPLVANCSYRLLAQAAPSAPRVQPELRRGTLLAALPRWISVLDLSSVFA